MQKELGTWIFSVGLHVGAFALAMYGIPGFEPAKPDTPPMIEVEFVQIADTVKVKAPDPKPEETEEAPAPTKRQVYAAAEAAPEPAAEAMPTMEKSVPEVSPKVKPDPVEINRQKLRQNVRPSFKPKPPSRLKINKLAALIDKSVKEEDPQKAIVRDETPEEPAPSTSPKLTGLAARVAQGTVIDALRQRISRCFGVQGGIKDLETMRVDIRLRLLRDGNLAAPARIVQEYGSKNSFYQAFKEEAMRAVKKCVPFDGLDQEHYDIWKDVIYKFDGSELTG